MTHVKVKFLSAGYLIRVVSWENDADSYRTEKITVPDFETADAICKFVLMFKSIHNSKNGIGNIYSPSSDEIATVARSMLDFTAEHPSIGDPFNLANQLGLMGEPDEFYTRVVDSITVYNVPADVHVEQITTLDYNRVKEWQNGISN